MLKKHICSSLLLLVIFSCADKKQRSTSWVVFMDGIGTYSSPRLADLNKDGIEDIVIGAGGREELHCDSAVVALDGATGKRLWAIAGENQYVGSAVFKDINKDGIPDVIIGGRWAQLSAIDGSNGKIIWRFFPGRQRTDGQDGGWYNFTTPQFIPDQDEDGIEDLLIANGGDARAAPNDPHRPAGRLLVLNSTHGKILANAVVPDGRETYMSVVCDRSDKKNPLVYFGTGGETLGGHLYRTRLENIMKADLGGATILASSEKKGFVSSPVLADITKDGIKDIIINAVDGKMMAINGATGSLLWSVDLPGTESYTIPAVGLFNNDSIPDFFSNFAIGIFPTLNYSVRFMVNGKTGAIEYRDTIPAFQYASPAAADLDGDGYDEAIVNQSAMKRTQFENVYYSRLFVFDFIHHKNYPLGDSLPATNLASTPWIGDMDGDQQMDIVYCAVKYQDIKFDLEKPLGLWIMHYATGIEIKKSPQWGAYMGSKYDNVY